MAVLHLLANPAAAASCLSTLADEDSLLLIGEGVLAQSLVAAPENPTVETPKVRLGVLAEDAERFGLATIAGVELLSYADFVAWVAECERSVTWT